MANLKQRTVQGMIWSGVERLSVQAVRFVVLVVMARLLTPDDYGLVGMLAIFLAISQTLTDAGFSSALIRRSDCGQADYSAVFFFNIAVAAGLYLIIFAVSPLIARFYEIPQLEPLAKVLALNIIIISFGLIQRVKLSVKLDFKTQAKSSFAAAVASGGLGIAMAAAGFGVWSLVAYTLANTAIDTALLWYFTKWMPSRTLKGNSFGELFRFGWKLTAAGLLDTFYRNIYTMAIGKRYGEADVGYYTRADSLAQFPSAGIVMILQRVSYPVMSTMQDEDERLRGAFLKYIRMTVYIIFPLMAGLSVLAPPTVRLLMGEKWDFAGEMLQVISLAYICFPLLSINSNLLLVKGRSDLYLRVEIIKKTAGLLILALTLPYGLIAMCWGLVGAAAVGTGVNLYYSGRLAGLGAGVQIRAIFPALAASAAVAAAVWLVAGALPADWMKVAAGVAAGGAVYAVISLIARAPELKELRAILKGGKENP